MQKAIKETTTSFKEESGIKKVYLYIQDSLLPMSGYWQWDMASNAVYCSDVMTAFPDGFLGTTGIIHPDDIPLIEEALEAIADIQFVNLQFRIITTYGQIKLLTGRRVHLDEQVAENAVQHKVDLLEKTLLEQEKENALGEIQLRKQAYEEIEKINQTGIFYFNIITNKGYYSDQVFQIYGLPPQSFNAHFNTFRSFIHTDDQETVSDVLDKAYQHELPIQLDYRIIRPTGEERWIRHILQWSFTEKGERLAKGLIQDYTVQHELEAKLQAIQLENDFLRQQLHHTEQTGSLGYWELNLLTRKSSYSDNYFRLFGLKPHSSLNSSRLFLQYVHPEDMASVNHYIQLLIREHAAPDIEYRIIRSDGKLRYLRQRGKLATNSEQELIISSVVQDITTQTLSQLQLRQLQQNEQVRQQIQNLTDHMAQLYNWVWHLDADIMKWSDSWYTLLGLKHRDVEDMYRYLQMQIYPEDQQAFTTIIQQTKETKTEQQLIFRLYSRGEILYLQAYFNLLQYEGKEILVGSFQDTTKEYQLNEELSRRMELNELITENLADRIVITDKENTILLWNKACEKAYNLKRQNVIGRNFFDIFPTLKQDDTLLLFNRALKGETIYQPTSKANLLNEYQELRMVPLKDKEGHVTGILHIIKDITKEYTLQQHLTERLNFIENLVENSVDRVIVMDKYMNYQVWNKKAEEYYSLSKQQVIGKNVLEVFPGIMNAPTFNEFKRALRGETVYIPAIEGLNTEWQHELYLIPIKDERNEVASVLWILHDLSKDFALRKNQKKASEVLDSINEIYFELDHTASIIYVNRKAEEFWQHTREELLGNNIWELFPNAINTGGYPLITKALNERTFTEGEYFSMVINRWVHMSATPSDDGVIVLFYDIDDMKRAQEKIASNEALLRQGETVAQTGSYEVAIPALNLHFSDGMYRLFGYEPNEVPSTLAFIDSISHPDDIMTVQQVIATAITTKQDYTYERRIYRKDGQLRYLRSKGKVVGDEKGNVVKLLGTIQDITEQRMAEEALVQHQQFLHQVTQTIPDLISILNVDDSTMTYVNDTKSLLGYEQQELIKMGFEGRLKTLIHPEDRDALVRFSQSVANTQPNEIRTLEYRIFTKDGQQKWVCNRSKALITNNPHFKHILTVLHDISEQKIAAEALKESKLFTEQIIEATPDFIVVFDFTQNCISYVNRNAYKGNEDRYQETLQLDYESILKRAHPDDREGLHQFIQSFRELPDQEIRTFEFREIRDTKTIWYQSRGKVFKRDEQGNVTHYISVVREITQEKELHQRIIDGGQFADVVIESSVNAIVVVDRDFYIKTWNRRAEEMYHLTKQQAINRRLIDLFPKAMEDAAIMNCFQRALEGDYMHLPAKLSVYTHRTCEFFYVPLKNDKEEVYGVLNIIHDVTRSEEYATALEDMNMILHQKNMELEQRNEEISTFAFVASHDLKEPLRKIHTFSDWLLDKETDNLSEKGKDFLKRLNYSVHRLNMLIDDILVLTKIHTDTRNQEDVNLTEIIKAVESDLEELIAETGATIITEPLPTITSNRNQMFYLFKNLIHNAIKFQQPEKRPLIEISANVERHVNHPNAQPRMEYLKIAIQDNGIGFDQKYVRKIFKIFQQLHSRGEYAGTGMGLAICRKIMENNQGFITAESTPGEGAVFTCYFPVY